MVDLTEIKDLVEHQGSAIEAFKTKYNTRVDSLERDLDEVVKKANRPAPVDGNSLTDEQMEYKAVFDKYLRTGLNESELKDMQTKNLISGSDPDGGYLVDDALFGQIEKLQRDQSAMRKIARTVRSSHGTLKFIVSNSDLGANWISEEESRPNLDPGTFNLASISAQECYANSKVSNILLDDSEIDLDMFIAEDVADKFSALEGAAFTNGDGVSKPRGIFSYDTSSDDDGTRSWGVVEYVASGAAGAFTSSAPEAALIDLVHAVKPKHRNRSSFLMNSETLATIRKWTDSSGLLWEKSLAKGQPSFLLGYPVFEDSNVPAIAADSLSIAFGDFHSFYTIVDRRGITLIRDNVTAKGFTQFYLTRRTGGGIINFEACKFMKMASS